MFVSSEARYVSFSPLKSTIAIVCGPVADNSFWTTWTDQWRNNTDKWNRMLFVLIDALPLEVAGKVYKGEHGYEHVKEIGSRE